MHITLHWSSSHQVSKQSKNTNKQKRVEKFYEVNTQIQSMYLSERLKFYYVYI